MRIYVIRHGLAGQADESRYPDDDERPLTSKGRKAFREAARGLLSLEATPARIFSSPALRALQTAEILARVAGLTAKSVIPMEQLHHAARPAAALTRLARMRLPATFALVGHEPWLGEFVSLLVTGRATGGIKLAKGGACLVKAEAARPGEGVLRWLLTQEQLWSLGRR